MLFDPDVLPRYKRNMGNGLRLELSKILQCHPKIISDSFRTVRNYIDVYPKLKREVNELYTEVLKKFVKM